MRYSEIRARAAAPDTHPFVADICMAPAAFERFERSMEHRQDVRLLARVDRPDVWVVHVACASEKVRAGLRNSWG